MDAEAHASRAACRFRHPFSRPRKDDTINPAPRSLSLLALLGAGVLLFAGCASGTAGAGAGSDASDGSASPTGSELEVEAGWLDGGRQIALVTWGSSGCTVASVAVGTQPDGALAVTLDDGAGDGAKACTADYAPRVTLVGVPEGVDPSKDLDLVVTDAHGSRGDTDIDGVAGLAAGGETDYAPSAGWIDDDLIAVLTWGSSSCAPQVETVEASDAKHVAAVGATAIGIRYRHLLARMPIPVARARRSAARRGWRRVDAGASARGEHGHTGIHRSLAST